MLPEISSKTQNLAHAHSKSFADALSDDYLFDFKSIRDNAGVRFLFFDKKQSTLLVTHGYSKKVHLLNLKNGKLRWFDHHNATVRSVQTTGSESLIITGSWDGTGMATSFDDLKKQMVFTDSDMGRLPYMAVSPDEVFVYSYSYDSDKEPAKKSNCVRAYNLSNGRMVHKISLLPTHLAHRRCGSVESFSGNLYVVSDTGFLEIYNLSTGQLVASQFFNDLLQSLCIIPNRNMVALAGDNGDVFICTTEGKLVTKVKAHKYYLSQLIVHPEKPDILISVSHDGMLKMWDTSKINSFLMPELELIETINMNNYNSLWTATTCNELVLSGGDSGVIEIHKIKNPTSEHKGNLVVYEDSFAFISADKKSFYASDLSLIDVRKTDGTHIDQKFADYLIKTTCNFKIFRDLFADNQEDLPGLINTTNGFLQLTK
jgi:WD40 repeat protein